MGIAYRFRKSSNSGSAATAIQLRKQRENIDS
jgi:hypothetical protein